jgi:hypothetical protein
MSNPYLIPPAKINQSGEAGGFKAVAVSYGSGTQTDIITGIAGLNLVIDELSYSQSGAANVTLCWGGSASNIVGGTYYMPATSGLFVDLIKRSRVLPRGEGLDAIFSADPTAGYFNIHYHYEPYAEIYQGYEAGQSNGGRGAVVPY